GRQAFLHVARGGPTDASGAFGHSPRASTETGTSFFQNSKIVSLKYKSLKNLRHDGEDKED
ncbi:MAG: hypothetical protein H6Q43_3075, partial [Deltaproteobacteria bacterium]|nr:hypothetical protein [Deltaproteobacteria bacterium]